VLSSLTKKTAASKKCHSRISVKQMNQSSEPLPVHAMLSAGLLTDVPGSRKQVAGTGRTFSAKANGIRYLRQ
jgi:hypothetical protein